MTRYCILDDQNVITNMIVTDEGSADLIKSIGALPAYDGAVIGGVYSPPEEVTEPSLEEKVDSLQKENALLKAQIQAQSDRADFIDDCIAEMAMTVYS